jgi:hypothetical protein
MEDIRARQRNIVFPETIQNEARFWRNLMDGKTPLGKVQIIGIAIMFLAWGTLLGSMIHYNLQHACGSGPLLDRLICAFSGWAKILALFGVLFLILRWRVRCAIRSIEEAKRSHHMQQ